MLSCEEQLFLESTEEIKNISQFQLFHAFRQYLALKFVQLLLQHLRGH